MLLKKQNVAIIKAELAKIMAGNLCYHLANNTHDRDDSDCDENSDDSSDSGNTGDHG